MPAMGSPLKHGLPDMEPAPAKDRTEKGLALVNGWGDRADGLSAGAEMTQAGPLEKFIGGSEPVLWMKRFIEKVAPLETGVLIAGPSGSGKALVAEIIHSLSNRAGRPFIKVNCASIPEERFELTLFGGPKDPSSGIDHGAQGKIEAARGGSLLFHNIGDMPLKVQGMLLSFVENKEIEKPGEHTPTPVDVRILATAKRSLSDLINQGAFREDLYYRLNVLSIQVPPLIDRLEDLPDLIQGLMARINPGLETPLSGISNEALGVLHSHDWPGNVRELQNVLERASILSDGPMIGEKDVRIALREAFAGPSSTFAGPDPAGVGQGGGLKETLHEVEKKIIMGALHKTGGVQTKAADLLGLTPKNLWKKIQKHAITLDRLSV